MRSTDIFANWDGMPEWIGNVQVHGKDLVIEGNRYQEQPLTFAAMKQLSEMFGTDLINVGSESRDDGFCETCSDPYDVVIVRVEGVTRYPKGYVEG